LGKGPRELDDSTALKKQVDQLKLINERKEQIQMMAKWREELANIEDEKREIVADQIDSYLDPKYESKSQSYRINEDYRINVIGKLVRKYSLEEIFDAIDRASRYLRDIFSLEDVEKFLEYIPKIAYWERTHRENPELAECAKLSSIARKKWYTTYSQQNAYKEIVRARRVFELSFKDIERLIDETSSLSFFESAVRNFEENSEAENDSEDE
jgi:hypothetical protein